jgi:hypothetical protein
VTAPSYVGGLRLADVYACAREAERLFQLNPHVVPARRAAAWARLADLLERAGADTVADLGPEAVTAWERELGFTTTGRGWDDQWPRDRVPVARTGRGPQNEGPGIGSRKPGAET